MAHIEIQALCDPTTLYNPEQYVFRKGTIQQPQWIDWRKNNPEEGEVNPTMTKSKVDPLIAQFFNGQLETRRGEKPAVFILSQAAEQQMALSKALPIQFHRGSKLTVDAFTKYRNPEDPTVYLQIMDTDDLIYCTGLSAEFRLARLLRGKAVECRSWTAGRAYSRLFCNQFWPKKDDNL
ncbi:MAG: hypothetical protein GY795_46280, partial [Desulfobacterales bacterium]|nr:hypothetical protein [Desulfobacterales bacterium]